MHKPTLLREHLVAANPWLRGNPERLQVFVDKGRAVSTGAPSLSFEYRYTVTLIVTDYDGHADALIVPLLAWLRFHEPDLVNNREKRKDAIRFEVEFLDTRRVDLSIEVDLTERVIIGRKNERPEALHAEHVGEPPDVDVPPLGERWELYLRDELIAAWDIRPFV